MNTTFEKKLKSIRKWRYAYLVMPFIVAIVDWAINKYGQVHLCSVVALVCFTFLSALIFSLHILDEKLLLKNIEKKVEVLQTDLSSFIFLISILNIGILSLDSMGCLFLKDPLASPVRLFIVLAAPYLLVFWKTFQSHLLFTTKTASIDLHVALPDLFETSKIVQYTWTMPIGDDETVWKLVPGRRCVENYKKQHDAQQKISEDIEILSKQIAEDLVVATKNIEEAKKMA